MSLPVQKFQLRLQFLEKVALDLEQYLDSEGIQFEGIDWFDLEDIYRNKYVVHKKQESPDLNMPIFSSVYRKMFCGQLAYFKDFKLHKGHSSTPQRGIKRIKPEKTKKKKSKKGNPSDSAASAKNIKSSEPKSGKKSKKTKKPQQMQNLSASVIITGKPLTSMNPEELLQFYQNLGCHKSESEKNSDIIQRTNKALSLNQNTDWRREFCQYVEVHSNFFRCWVCGVQFRLDKQINQHLQSRQHRMSIFGYMLGQNRSKLISGSYGIKVTADDVRRRKKTGVFVVETAEDGVATVNMTIRNQGPYPVLFKRCEIVKTNRMFSLYDMEKVTENNGKTVYMEQGSTYRVVCRFQSGQVGTYNVPLLFTFSVLCKDQPIASSYIVRFIEACCSNDLVQAIKPVSKYQPLSRSQARLPAETGNNIIPGLKLQSGPPDTLEKTVPLPMYFIPNVIQRFLFGNSSSDGSSKRDKQRELEHLVNTLNSELVVSSFVEKFDALLHLEESQMDVDIRMYDMEGVTLRVCKTNRTLLMLKVPGLSENRPSVLRGDWLYVRVRGTDGSVSRQEFQGIVHEVHCDEVALGFNSRFRDCFINNMKFNVRFVFNRLPLRLQHRAVHLAQDHNLNHIVFPSKDMLTSGSAALPELRLYNALIENNEEQKAAVQHIVAGTSLPAPYIVFGPPGTGKTVTMVEAIKQVWKTCKGHILACAPSNSAADLIAQRLLQHIPKDQILRLYASSRNVDLVPPDLKEVSNYQPMTRQWHFHTKSVLCRYRILITTLTTAGRLASADFPQDHFTHVFIDEAGQATEPELLIGVAGIMERGQLVIAGDPRQLGPVLRSRLALRCGLGMPMLERLMDKCDLYRPRHKQTAGLAAGGEESVDDSEVEYDEDASDFSYEEESVEENDESEEEEEAVEITDEEDESSSSFEEGVRTTVIHDTDSDVSDLEWIGPERYDRNVITKLLKNYRSHPAILEVPNMLFYDSELIASADEMQREKLCQWDGLPVKDFPVVFHGVIGEDKREERSPSFFNGEEAATVFRYVQRLLEARSGGINLKPKDIGIITPYRKQVQKIRQLLKKKYSEVSVGSVEEFQGQERPVIIVSTVRSNPEYLSLDAKFSLGFLQNPKRFNVTITRAKALLIVIGNPNTLGNDTYWRRFIQYCARNGSYIGTEWLNPEDEMEDLLQRFQAIGLVDGNGNFMSDLQPDTSDQPWRQEM